MEILCESEKCRTQEMTKEWTFGKLPREEGKTRKPNSLRERNLIGAFDNWLRLVERNLCMAVSDGSLHA